MSSDKPSARRAIQSLPQQIDPKSTNKYVCFFFLPVAIFPHIFHTLIIELHQLTPNGSGCRRLCAEESVRHTRPQGMSEGVSGP